MILYVQWFVVTCFIMFFILFFLYLVLLRVSNWCIINSYDYFYIHVVFGMIIILRVYDCYFFNTLLVFFALSYDLYCFLISFITLSCSFILRPLYLLFLNLSILQFVIRLIILFSIVVGLFSNYCSNYLPLVPYFNYFPICFNCFGFNYLFIPYF